MTNTNTKFHIFHPKALLVFALMFMLGMSMSTALTVHASGGTCGEDLSWSLSGGALTISGNGDMTDFTDDDMPPWYGEAPSITKVTVGEGVTKIGQLAFYGCSNLSSVSLPSTLKTIGARSFKECSALSYVGLPASLETIEEAAFEDCASLSGIRLPNGLKVIDNYAFYRCASLTSITIPASVIRLGMVTFAYCDKLTQATIDCAITRLPDWTFYECGSLSSVVLPDTVTSTGDKAFYECDRLDTVHYTGVSEEAKKALEEATGGKAQITEETHSGSAISGSGSFREDGSGGTGTSTKVQETGNSITETKTKTESSFLINGEPAAAEDLENRPDEIEVESDSTITVSSAVSNSDGWTEVAEQVKEIIEKNKKDIKAGKKIQVTVHITGTKVEGSDLVKMADDAIRLEVITKNGDAWKMDMASVDTKKTAKKTYDFGISVTEAGKTDIPSDTVFQVTFEQDSDFLVTVGIYVGYPNELATLYQKKGGDYEKIQTARIDSSGTAWFSLASIDEGTDYFIGINAEGVTDYEAVRSDGEYDTYYVEEDGATLTDAEGRAYKITGRSSSLGISGKQFMIYVGIAMGAVILIVALAMITWNKLRLSKEKYALPNEAEEGPIDEDALRLKVMQELLEETKASNAKSTAKTKKKTKEKER